MENPRAITLARPSEQGIQTRSFAGCDTCRSRHVKCDERRPICSTCEIAQVPCAGFRRTIFFEHDAPSCIDDDGKLRFRRLLFSESERQDMSAWLVSTVPPKSALWHILQLDAECEQHTGASNGNTDISLTRGPFGAFRLGSTSDSTSQVSPSFGVALEVTESTPTSAVDNESQEDQNVAITPVDFTSTAWNPSSHQPVLDTADQCTMLSYIDLWDTTLESDFMQDIFDAFSRPDSQNVPLLWPPFQGTSVPVASGLSMNQSISPLSLGSWMPTSDLINQDDAILLLKYYSTTVVGFLNPLQHTKTPWSVLFIPHAKMCLASMSFGEQLDDSSLCTFYSLLAISAMSLGGAAGSQIWLDKGIRYKGQAQEHCTRMLKYAYDVPKKAKYKVILMALYTMMQLSNLMGKREQAEFYFLESEKFIRLRGLNRKKSRKVRLLHHCYAYERMLHESTYICVEESQHRNQVRNAVESSGLAIYSSDSLTYRLPSWRDLDQEMLTEKTQVEGENDLHNERLGSWSKTLYPEIFGIPENWLMLTSLVIRLGKEKDAAEAQTRGSGGSMSLQEYLGRAKTLEKFINQQKMSFRPPPVPSAATTVTCALPGEGYPLSDQAILTNMLEAMHCAMAIYFYRRIYDLDSSLLQSKVRRVRECLDNYPETASACGTGPGTGGSSSSSSVASTAARVACGSVSFAWSAFIAACEADGPELQDSFARWFESRARRTGMNTFSHALSLARQVWRRKCEAQGGSTGGVTWVDLLRRRGMNVSRCI
ncbi:fungal-specific transcription factor domain-containing protein [Xylariales sp. PMI_506]|nr:fungal-specific transcription factor domain-containing protein [Xylariales sp. PMI_506]